MEPLDRADVEHTVELAAPPETVWSVVSDITRTPEWSPVVHRSEWVGEPAAPATGARFRGHNRFNGFRWSRDCVVTEAAAPQVFAFSTLGPAGEEQTRWRYSLDPAAAGGTRVTLGFQVVTTPRWVEFLERLPGGRRTSEKQARSNLVRSLERLAQVVS